MAKRRRRKQTSNVSPLVSMFFGLAVGLSVAAAVYMKDRRPQPIAATQAPASMQSALDDNNESAKLEKKEKEEPRFTFYEMLPNYEVVTQDIGNEPVAARAEPQAIVEPGKYVLQAGSFSTNSDADRRRAELAMHGIVSNIQRVSIDGRDYHRVWIGPISDLDELNMLRSRLRAAQIDVLRIRVGD